MVLAVAESSSAAVAAAWIAGAGLIASGAAAVISYLTFRRGRKAPGWHLDPTSDPKVCQLVQTGDAAAREVRITVEPDLNPDGKTPEGGYRVDGQTEFETFQPGARCSLNIFAGWGSGHLRVHVRWRGTRNRPGHWSSDLPG